MMLRASACYGRRWGLRFSGRHFPLTRAISSTSATADLPDATIV